MTVKYGSDGDVTPSGICVAVRDCYRRLEAVVMEIPDDEGGEIWPGVAVIESVIEYLARLHDELHEWCHHKWPDISILPRLYRELYGLCLQRVNDFGEKGTDAHDLARAVVNELLAEALGGDLDPKRAMTWLRSQPSSDFEADGIGSSISSVRTDTRKDDSSADQSISNRPVRKTSRRDHGTARPMRKQPVA